LPPLRPIARSLRPTWSRLAGQTDHPKSRKLIRRSRTRSERFRFVDADGTERIYDRFEDVPPEMRRRMGGLQSEAERMLEDAFDDVVFDDDHATEFTYEVTVEDGGAGALELLEDIRNCFGDLVDDALADDG
jgi:hypothetical protein